MRAPLFTLICIGNPKHKGNYTPGGLYVEEVTDENGHVRRTYTNFSGNTVMTEEGDGADMLRTRYVYDDYGRLRFILPPSFTDGDASASDDDFVKKCYELKYDNFGRISAKRLAGSQSFHTFAYSKSGRLVAEHTPAMVDSQWFVYFYDCRGRKVLTSKTSLTVADMAVIEQKFYTASYAGMIGNSQNTTAGYAIEPTPTFPIGKAFCAEYFDNYDFLGLPGASEIPNPGQSRAGLPTGSADYATGTALYSAVVYDQWGRV